MTAILRIAQCGLLLGAIAGCAGTAPPVAHGPRPTNVSLGDMNAAMSSWKGRRAYEAVAMWGMPDSITREGAMGLLRWKADAADTGSRPWGAPFSDAEADTGAARQQSWPTRCARVLAVDVEEIVQRANWARSEGCSTDPADYLPPP